MRHLDRRRFLICTSAATIALRFPAASHALPRGTATAAYPIGAPTAAEIPESRHPDDVTLISEQAIGSRSANLFAAFTSPESTVTLKSGTKFLARTDGPDNFCYSSSYNYLDSEISTNVAGDFYTFGCVGFDVYVKCRGVEILRYKEWRHVAAGHAATWQQQGQGVPDTTTRDAPAQLLGSNRDRLTEMGKAGHLWMESDFGWDSLASSMLSIYHRLGGKEDRPSSVAVM
jgi:hypothetical protein